MALAGLVNLARLVLAACVVTGSDVDSIEEAHAGLGDILDPGTALAVALALLASGFAASSVGTYRGAGRPAGLPAAHGAADPAPGDHVGAGTARPGGGRRPRSGLVLSQVVLSFGIPFALVPLVLLTRRRDVMGELVNARRTTATACVVAALIIFLNVFLLVRTFAG